MRIVLVALIVLAGIVPAAAAPNCLVRGSSITALGDDGLPSELAQMEVDKMRLRAVGINAMWVERWQGCIKVTRRGSDGRLVTEYYNPSTLEVVF